MLYTVHQLAELTGLTPRTLRYYDSIGLLRAERQRENDYRCYGEAEVERLWRILRYREMGLALEEIGRLLDAGDEKRTLTEHLCRLEEEQRQLAARVERVRAALAKEEDIEMEFEKLKAQAIKENEEQYGAELREKYGEEVITKCNHRVAALNEEEWNDAASLEEAYLAKLREAMAADDPACEAAMEACRLHYLWLGCYWAEGMRTPDAHKGLVEMYDLDERFRDYYAKKVGEGCAAFFARAIGCYYEN